MSCVGPRFGFGHKWRRQARGWRHEKTSVQGCQTEQETRSYSPSHQESVQSPRHQNLALLQFWRRSRAADAVCPMSGRCVTSSITVGLPHIADPAVQAGIECIKQWLVVWSGRLWTSINARSSGGPGASASSSVTLDEGSRPMRAIMCVLLDAVWFLLHPSNWKQAGGAGDAGVHWVVYGSGELVEIMSHDVMSVHWVRAATH